MSFKIKPLDKLPRFMLQITIFTLGGVKMFVQTFTVENNPGEKLPVYGKGKLF
jgi:hypothetical protein